MKKLLCVILALPLVAFGVENAVDSADSNRESTNIKTFDSTGAKSSSKKFRQKGIKTKEPDGFMLGIGNVFGGVIGGNPYNKADGLTLLPFKFSPRAVPLTGLELLAGYKWFFGESGKFGMRLYGRYEFRYELGDTGIATAMTNIGSLNYDLLFNFNSNESFKAGMILGILLGGGKTDYLSYSMKTTDEYGVTNYNDITLNNTYDTKFSLGVNIGFRFVIYDRSAIEILFQPQFNFKDKFVIEGNKLHEFSDISTGSEISLMGMTRFIYTF